GLGSDESGDFSRFGEPSGPRTRAAMYDEGLEVIRAVWSGRAFRHDGQHYHVTLDEGAGDPRPVPVWVASSTGHPRVIRRAAACDGIFPNPPDRTPAAGDIAGLLAALHRAGLPQGRAFDVAVAGSAS